MVFTDVASEVESASQKMIDRAPTLHDVLCSTFAPLIQSCEGATYLCLYSWNLASSVISGFTAAGGVCSQMLVWDKHRRSPGRCNYQQQYEPILYGCPQGRKPYWRGGRNQGDVWSVPSSHGTKPVDLIERAVSHSSKTGDVVLDPFAGSGTTLIACQRLGRKACLLETDPRYIDQICLRWQQFTGEPAILGTQNLSFAKVQQARQNA